MGPAAAERLFRCENLRDLLVLEVYDCPVGGAAASLADEEVLPDLVSGFLSYCSVPPRQARELVGRGTIRVHDP